jgi:hypothetical protein
MYIQIFTQRRLIVQKFDILKRTLTNFKPSEYAAATGAAPTPQQAATGSAQSAADDVPKGRTTLNIGKARGIVQPPAKPKREAAAPPAAAVRPEPVETAALPAAVIRPEVGEETAPAAAIAPEPVEESAAPPAAAVRPELADADAPEWNSPAPIVVEEDVEINFPDITNPRTETAAASPARTEAAAALHVRAAQRRPKKAVDPQDSIAVNLRIPKYLKDTFYKTCRDNDATPSIVLRNMIKSYCGL